MLERAQQRCSTLAAGGRLYQMDVTDLELPTGSSMPPCDLPVLRVAERPPGSSAPRTWARRQAGWIDPAAGVCATTRYVSLDHVADLQPWIAWACRASFDRHTEKHMPGAGLELVESRYVVNDLLKLITVRAPA